MERRTIRFGSILLILISWIAVTGTFISSQVSSADEEGQKGCKSCHSKLSETLPKDHPRVEQEEVQSCLTCHAAKGEAASWGWIVHFGHYSAKGFEGDCWSCHLIDKAGKFEAYDSRMARLGLTTSKEEVGGMASYYKSWGSSGHLDHKHGLKKLSCGACHDAPFPSKRVPTERCIGCHGNYDQLAQKSSIHASGFWTHFSEKEIGCNACHKAHQDSVFLCNQCHTFDQKMP